MSTEPCFIVIDDPAYLLGNSSPIAEKYGAVVCYCDSQFLAEHLINKYKREVPDRSFSLEVVSDSILDEFASQSAIQDWLSLMGLATLLKAGNHGLSRTEQAVVRCYLTLEKLRTERKPEMSNLLSDLLFDETVTCPGKQRKVKKSIVDKVKELLLGDYDEQGPGFDDAHALISALEASGIEVTGSNLNQQRITISKAIGTLRDSGMVIQTRPYKLVKKRQ